MIIRKIEPQKQVQIKRAIAYIRTSTKMESQSESYETQYKVYKDMIDADDTLAFAGVYADKKSGTDSKHRPGFTKMCADAEAKKFDIVYVKSISRFSRNVGVMQRTVDRFRELGITIIFEEDRIRTDDFASNLVLGLIGSVAQDESHSISKNVAMGYHERFARGEFNLGNNRILGYDTVDGKLEPNGDAWIVKEIFERFVAGESMGGIARAMNEKGARTLKGGTFCLQTVRYILKNETYVGDKHLQKTPPRDYVTKKPDRTAKVKDYYLTDDHTPIVDRETWNRAQERMKNKGQYDYCEHHIFYGKVFCGECGASFKRRTIRMKNGDHYKSWNCGERQKGSKGNGCKMRIVKEDDLMEQVLIKLGWVEMDEELFERTVERVLVMEDGVEIEMKAESMSA